MDIVNNRRIAIGEVVVIDENFGFSRYGYPESGRPCQAFAISILDMDLKGGHLMGNRILVVDDAAFMRMMVKDILTKNGYEVIGEASDGRQAIEKYQELKPRFGDA